MSNFGRVRIRDSKNRTFRFAKVSEENNLLSFTYLSADGSPLKYSIHRAVALTFLKPENQDLFVVHKDFNLQNNCYMNLKFVDFNGLKKHRLNKEKFYHTGKYREITNKLDLEQVKEIKKKLDKNATYVILLKLAKRYNVRTKDISRIKLSDDWVFIGS